MESQAKDPAHDTEVDSTRRRLVDPRPRPIGREPSPVRGLNRKPPAPTLAVEIHAEARPRIVGAKAPAIGQPPDQARQTNRPDDEVPARPTPP